jgi:Haem-binding domain
VKAFLFKHARLGAGVFVGLLALCSIAVHPFGSMKLAQGQAVPAGGLKVQPEIAAVLKRSCMDCHSNQTAWPWYSYVAPVSWLVERDVRRGRDHMNLSEWSLYDVTRQQKLLADIASAVKNREMPLPQYMLVHRDAKLSDADTDLVYGWARLERRKLRSSHKAVPFGRWPCR